MFEAFNTQGWTQDWIQSWARRWARRRLDFAQEVSHPLT